MEGQPSVGLGIDYKQLHWTDPSVDSDEDAIHAPHPQVAHRTLDLLKSHLRGRREASNNAEDFAHELESKVNSGYVPLWEGHQIVDHLLRETERALQAVRAIRNALPASSEEVQEENDLHRQPAAVRRDEPSFRLPSHEQGHFGHKDDERKHSTSSAPPEIPLPKFNLKRHYSTSLPSLRQPRGTPSAGAHSPSPQVGLDDHPRFPRDLGCSRGEFGEIHYLPSPAQSENSWDNDGAMSWSFVTPHVCFTYFGVSAARISANPRRSRYRTTWEIPGCQSRERRPGPLLSVESLRILDAHGTEPRGRFPVARAENAGRALCFRWSNGAHDWRGGWDSEGDGDPRLEPEDVSPMSGDEGGDSWIHLDKSAQHSANGTPSREEPSYLLAGFPGPQTHRDNLSRRESATDGHPQVDRHIPVRTRVTKLRQENARLLQEFWGFKGAEAAVEEVA
ncbi:hypothetical protein T439DRAFT_337619 [Meredithblackwellia eburnea MCA 4105]